MRINFALILWRRMIEFPPALLALPKHQSMTICSPCSSTPPSSLHLPTTVRPNTLWTKILNLSKKIHYRIHQVVSRIFCINNESTNFSPNWVRLYFLICDANVNNNIHFHRKKLWNQNWWNYLMNSLHTTKMFQSLVGDKLKFVLVQRQARITRKKP